MDIKHWKFHWALAMLLVGMGVLVGACDSDPVAPHDDDPELTETEAVQHAAAMAVGLARVGPELLNFDGSKPRDKDLGIYEYSFPGTGFVSGTIVLEYFEGGAGGTYASWEDADYGLLYVLDDPETPDQELLEITLDLGEGVEPEVAVGFDLHGDINQTANTAAVAGSGSILSGVFDSSFTIADDDPVLLSGVNAFPQGGALLFNVDSHVILVVYDGDQTAGVLIGGVAAYVVDLETGFVTPIS